MKDINSLNITATHIMFISDIHFGKHVNAEEWQENMHDYFFNFFLPKLKEEKSKLAEDETLVCINLGDTYDDRKTIDINVNNLAIDVSEAIAKEVPYYVLNGNHDLAKKTNEGNSSLRSIQYIPNLTLINEPTILNIECGKSTKTKVLAVPYLGNPELETSYLAEYSTKAKYALMHTELTRMKMDNGMLITSGCNPDMFKGMILSGHIHRRQETKHIIYVGAPYHMSKGDIGDTKGIYVLNLKTNKLTFTENTYSPIYHTTTMDKYAEMDISERQRFLNNNYNYIIMDEDDLPKWKKKYDIYNLGVGTTAKMVKPVINKHKINVDIDEDIDYKEKSIGDLIDESIKSLELDDAAKDRLYKLSKTYLEDAEAKLQAD